MSVDHRRFLTMLVCGAAAPIVALGAAAVASADPDAPPPAPSPVLPLTVQAAQMPALPPSPAVPGPPPAAVAGPATPGDAAALAAAPQGVPHLASPDALPPGSTMDPDARSDQNPNVGYARDLWQAVQNHEISGKQALLLGRAQRGMNSPIPAQAPGPNVPIAAGGVAPAQPAPMSGPTAPGPVPAPLGAAPGPVPAPAVLPAPGPAVPTP